MFNEGRNKVKRSIVHPKFNKETLENNLALLELEELLNFGSGVLPGCLDTQNSSRNYGDLVVSGFGLTSKLVLDHDSGWPVGFAQKSRNLKELDYKDISGTEPRCQTFKDSLCVDSKSAGTDESVCLGDEGKFSF